MPDFTSDGIDRTAAAVREHAARNGQQITHEQARTRVLRAVRNEENIRRHDGGR